MHVNTSASYHIVS